MINCPCYDCICVPICQNKDWIRLIKSCALICEYFREYELNIPRNHHLDVDIIPLKQHYRLSKSVNGMITYGIRRNEQISTMIAILNPKTRGTMQI